MLHRHRRAGIVRYQLPVVFPVLSSSSPTSPCKKPNLLTTEMFFYSAHHLTLGTDWDRGPIGVEEDPSLHHNCHRHHTYTIRNRLFIRDSFKLAPAHTRMLLATTDWRIPMARSFPLGQIFSFSGLVRAGGLPWACKIWVIIHQYPPGSPRTEALPPQARKLKFRFDNTRLVPPLRGHTNQTHISCATPLYYTTPRPHHTVSHRGIIFIWDLGRACLSATTRDVGLGE